MEEVKARELGVIPEPNLFLCAGEKDSGFVISIRERKTPLKRIKWWLFCKFFPFQIEEWDDLS